MQRLHLHGVQRDQQSQGADDHSGQRFDAEFFVGAPITTGGQYTYDIEGSDGLPIFDAAFMMNHIASMT